MGRQHVAVRSHNSEKEERWGGQTQRERKAQDQIRNYDELGLARSRAALVHGGRAARWYNDFSSMVATRQDASSCSVTPHSLTSADARRVVPVSPHAPCPARTLPLPLQSQEERMVFFDAMSMNLMVGHGFEATGHAKVVNPESTNMTMGESSHEPVTPRKDNVTSNMLTDDPELEFVDGDKGEENCPTKQDNPNASSYQNVPTEGMCFQSEEEAYKFYNAYAKMKGFSIRRTHTKTRVDGSLAARYLVCSKDGVKEKHCTHETKKEQASTRTSCKARAQFRITREGVWNI